MEENNIFSCELQMFFSAIPNFKEKQSTVLNSIISNGRLGQEIKFSTFANISFDKTDTQLRFPKFTPMELFSRSKTNCLIFDMLDTDKNKGVFTKCCIFMQGGHDIKYSFLLYNENTKRVLHKFLIPFEDDTLIIAIQNTINNFVNTNYIDKFAHRLDSMENYLEYVDMMKKKEAEKIIITNPLDKYNNRRY